LITLSSLITGDTLAFHLITNAVLVDTFSKHLSSTTRRTSNLPHTPPPPAHHCVWLPMLRFMSQKF